MATPTETTTYILYVLTPDGCAGTNTVTVSVNGNALNGSTSKQDGIRIAAYPNPASEILTVNADAGHNEAGIESMTLYNLYGQEIFHFENGEGERYLFHQVDVSKLAAGQYTLKVKAGEKVAVKKVTVF